MSCSSVLLAARSTALSEDGALAKRSSPPKKAIQQRRYAPKTRTGIFHHMCLISDSYMKEPPDF
jgi:hypothetical protein